MYTGLYKCVFTYIECVLPISSALRYVYWGYISVFLPISSALRYMYQAAISCLTNRMIVIS